MPFRDISAPPPRRAPKLSGDLGASRSVDGIVQDKPRQPAPMPPPLPVEVSPPKIAPKPERSNHSGSSRLVLAALIVAAIAVLVIGMVIFVQTIRTNKAVLTKFSPGPSTASPNTPASVPLDEHPVSATQVQKYAVSPDLPRLLSIPKLGISSRVFDVGILANGQLGAPTNIYDTAWYDQSSKPGQSGASLIVGHMTGVRNLGVFTNLDKLVAGDVISLQRGDGTIFNYKVVQLKTFPVDKVDMVSALSPIVAGKPGLNLMTCAGDFSSSKNNYSERLVIYATAN